jgi:hypothetical protein
LYQTAVEDHDFARGREMGHIALQAKLRLLAVGRHGQRHHPEHARAHPLGDHLDHAAQASAVASLEHHDDAQTCVLDPFPQPTKLDLQVPQRLFIVLAIHRLSSRFHGRIARFAAKAIVARNSPFFRSWPTPLPPRILSDLCLDGRQCADRRGREAER